MKYKLRVRIWALLLLAALLLLPLAELSAQDVAAFKQSLAKNQQQLRQYQWIETTAISMKGEVKSQVQKTCFYGPDGQVQKQEISATQAEMPGGLKGKVAAKKKAEIQAYMQEAMALVKQYVPPDGQRIQAAKDAGNLSFTPAGGGLVLTIRNYLKPGDALTLNVMAGMELKKVSVNTYMDSPEDKVTMDVDFASLSNGVDYPGKIVLNAPAKQIQVVVANTNYQMIAPAAVAQAPPPQGPAMSPQQIDALTAPIALYPDALVNQILEASIDVLQLQSFAGWMSKNAAVYGTGLQDAANKAGFSQCYVALVPFSQVVQMMTQKLDWTTQLGQAFKTNRAAVFDSIQRLRAQAAKAGTLVTNQQQTVTTQTTSTGETVYVVYPTNPQVVYVPTYNPTTVYVVEDNPNEAAAAAVGFTAGIIIGAAASNNYYYGPYGWHGGYAYNEAWNNSQHRQDNRQDSYSQNSQYRQDTHQTNQTQRQDTHQTNQSTRQDTHTTNQSTRQSTAQTNQSTRQSSASSAQGSAQANQSSRQSSASSAQGSRSSAANTSSAGSGQASGQRSGMSSGGFSGGGYQSGSTTRSQSSRGSSSLSSSRGGGGGRSGGGGGGGRR